MSARIRGQEATIRINVSDQFAAAFGIFGQLQGSFFKVRDFTLTVRQDLVEQEYIGEKFDDLDTHLHGYDFSFTIDELDSAALDFMSLIVNNEENSLAPPEVSVSVTYLYRETVGGVPITQPRTEKLIDCVMKLNERSIGGRKEYIQNSFEGKAKQRRLFVG